jgi:hypothetical protein
MKYLLFAGALVLVMLAAWRFSAAPARLHLPTWGNTTVDGARDGYLLLKKTTDSLCVPARKYAAAHGMNDSIAFLANYSLHSGLKRLAVVNIQTGKILDTGLVAHGSGKVVFSATPAFSNTPNSYCSSLGRYRVGAAYAGRFGTSFKLHGLDKTNSNALARFVVLHPYDCVPDEAPYPDYICNSQGCPMVSYAYQKRLSRYIRSSEKPLLLWIVK